MNPKWTAMQHSQTVDVAKHALSNNVFSPVFHSSVKIIAWILFIFAEYILFPFLSRYRQLVMRWGSIWSLLKFSKYFLMKLYNWNSKRGLIEPPKASGPATEALHVTETGMKIRTDFGYNNRFFRTTESKHILESWAHFLCIPAEFYRRAFTCVTLRHTCIFAYM